MVCIKPTTRFEPTGETYEGLLEVRTPVGDNIKQGSNFYIGRDSVAVVHCLDEEKMQIFVVYPLYYEKDSLFIIAYVLASEVDNCFTEGLSLAVYLEEQASVDTHG